MYKPHIQLAHSIWKKHVNPGDVIVDATCGNGHDSLVLAQLALTPDSGQLHCIDIQEKALTNTQRRLSTELPPTLYSRINFHLQSHEIIPECRPNLIVYNLGYLPGSDKKVKTAPETTLLSIKSALNTLTTKGLMSVMCYPGHPEGEQEEKVLISYLATLDSSLFSVQYSSWVNRPKHPTLTTVSKH